MKQLSAELRSNVTGSGRCGAGDVTFSDFIAAVFDCGVRGECVPRRLVWVHTGDSAFVVSFFVVGRAGQEADSRASLVLSLGTQTAVFTESMLIKFLVVLSNN